jgi:hypothetical protein
MCHCVACQRRTGSAFGLQAVFDRDKIDVEGRYSDYSRFSDDGDRREHIFHFCPDCGSQVFQSEPEDPDYLLVAVGAFADPAFPEPRMSHYDHRKHPWVTLPEAARREALWDDVRPLYEAGRYGEAADQGRALLEANPGSGRLTYNTACCESLAGRTDDAIEHLRQAIAIWEGCRDLAERDSDFDPIRDEPGFAELLSHTESN